MGNKDSFSGSMLTGDLALWSVFDIQVTLNPNLLTAFPTLDAFYKRVSANPGVAALSSSLGMYFKQ